MEKTEKKPNIIMILADDQGPWAMHCAGTPELYTPNLDRIAEQGMRFDSFFCASPVCSPARASILTGKMPSAHGVQDWLRSGNLDGEKFAAQGKENPYFEGYKQERKPISYLEGQPTYTDILAQNGYHCALSGKWHLGNSIEPQQGFQEWYTIGMGGCCYYHPDMVDHGEITVHHGEYVTDLITDRALEYLKELGEGDDPFYLSVHYTAPHSPWEKEHHPAKWIDYYDGCTFPSIPNVPDHPDLRTGAVYGTGKREENLRGYFAAISAMDEQIGRLLDAVEEQGLADNTVILFTADNGMSMGQHGVWGKGNGTFPMNMYDSAVKVPFLISWPGHIPANTVCSEMISACDLLPTILKLTGLSDKQPTGLPGRSFTELLEGRQLEHRDEVVIFDEYGPVRMIRTKEWKYVHRYPYGKHELYHLVDDPGEEKNLYGLPEYKKLVTQLKGRMEKWFCTYSDPAIDGVRSAVNGSGQLCRPGVYAIYEDPFSPKGVE